MELSFFYFGHLIIKLTHGKRQAAACFRLSKDTEIPLHVYFDLFIVRTGKIYLGYEFLDLMRRTADEV